MANLELNFLGRFAARLAGQVITGFESDKVRLLLAYLAIESDRPHRRESLAGLFWPESPENQARHNLTQALYNLRHVICTNEPESCLELSAKDVRFRLGKGVKVDTVRFLELHREVTTHSHPAAWVCQACSECLKEVVILFQGELLAGFSLPDSEIFEDWLRTKRSHLDNLAKEMLRALVQSNRKRGNLDQALDNSQLLVALDPFDEANQRQLLTLLAQNDRRSEAIKQYLAYQHLLADELDIEPEAQTIDLYESIRDRPETFLPQPVPNNLPVFSTRFIGRDAEIEHLYWKLVDPSCRLVTILGMGGSGKTRLALEAGKNILPVFPDGIFWIDLSVLSSVHDILPVISRTLGVPLTPYQDNLRQAGQEKKLLDTLREKELLLILDGAEMVLEGVISLLDILHQTPGVKVLVTSRMRLNLQREHLMILEGLPFPTGLASGWEEFPAVRLFDETARRSRPDFSLSSENAPAVVGICHAVQGMPLAILLASAWASTLPPWQILQEIRSNLDFLSAGWQDLPARQQSLRATFDYSWELLWKEKRSLLRRLAIFRQPFTTDEAIHIAQTTIFDLKALQDFSLVQRVSGDRLRLHDLVRQYAQDKLNQAAEENLEIHQRLSSYFLLKLKTSENDLHCSQKQRALAEMDLEIENSRLAWHWAVGQGDWIGLKTAVEGLCIYYEKRGQAHSGESACALALSPLEKKGIDQDNLQLWARLSSWQAYFLMVKDLTEQGLVQLERVLQELLKETWQSVDTGWERAQALYFKACGLVRQDNPTTLLVSTQSAQIFSQYGERWYAAKALARTAEALESLSRHAEQIQVIEKALELQATEGDPELVSYLQYVHGLAYLYSGDHEKGSQIILASLEGSSHPEAKQEILRATKEKMTSMVWSGNFHQALPQIELNRSVHQELGTPLDGLESLGVIAINWGLGRYDQVIAFAISIPVLAYNNLARIFIGTIHLLRDENNIARNEFELALQEAAQATDTRFIALALAFLSIACFRLGERERSREILYQAIQEGLGGTPLGISVSLLAVVYYLLELGEILQALETYTASIKIPAFGKSAWTHDFLGARLEEMAHALPDGAAEAARARGRVLELPALAADWLGKVKQLIPG